MVKNGNLVTLPLTRGTGKNPLIASYANLLPVNMLSVPPKMITDAGFMRNFPGLEKKADVDGASRGVLLSAADGLVYRVCGGKLYQGEKEIGDVSNTDRVSIASSTQSVAVASGGKMIIFKSDGTQTTLDNWPPAVFYPGETTILQSGKKSEGYDGTIKLTQEMVDEGTIKLTLTPATTSGAVGEPLELDRAEKYFDQEPPAEGTPYITEAFIWGFEYSGETLTVTYTLNLNGATGDDATEFMWKHIVESSSIKYAQYDLGEVADICHANSRYAWIKKGTNEWGVTSIRDETKPDQERPIMSAEAYPDKAVGIAELNGDIVVFGTVSTEYFTLTGSTTSEIYRSQQSLLIPVGIAGTHCKARVGDQFAIISNPACGRPSVYLLGGGRASEIATPEIVDVLSAAYADDLASGVVESFGLGKHQLIIIRVAELVFCYDMTSKNWCQLASGNGSAPYPAIDIVQEGRYLTAGDVKHSRTGAFTDKSASQYGELQPHLLYTPLISMTGRRLFDLQLETATGLAEYPEHLAVSATTDGSIFPAEMLIRNDAPHHYDVIPFLSRVGFVKRNIGFRFRILSRTPFTVNSAKVRAV